MMFWLAANVFADWINVHWAHAEFAVAGLPFKTLIPEMFPFYPTGRGAFDLPNNLCWSMVFGLGEQDVNVIPHGIYFDQG